MAIPGIALPFVLYKGLGSTGMIAGIVVTVIYGVLLAITSATLQEFSTPVYLATQKRVRLHQASVWTISKTPGCQRVDS